MTPVNFATALHTILAISTMVGFALAGLCVGYVKLTRETNTDLRARNADLEAENKILKADRDALARVVTGEVWSEALGVKIEQLDEHMKEHHAEAMSAWSGIARAIGELKP